MARDLVMRAIFKSYFPLSREQWVGGFSKPPPPWLSTGVFGEMVFAFDGWVLYIASLVRVPLNPHPQSASSYPPPGPPIEVVGVIAPW